VVRVRRLGNSAVLLGDNSDHVVEEPHVVEAEPLGGFDVRDERLQLRSELREFVDVGSELQA